MNKRNKIMKTFKNFYWILLATGLLLSGCNEFPSEPRFYEKKIDGKKIHEVQRLDIDQYRSEEQPDRPSVLDLPDEPKDKIDLNLQQCRALAMENNLELKVQLLAPTIAAEGVNAERAKFEAAFYTNVTYAKTDQPAAKSTLIEGSQSESSNVDLGVEVPLQTGGKITFDLADNRTKSNLGSSTFNPSYSNDLSVSISQPLLKGAGVRVNNHSIRITEYDKTIIDSRTKLEVIRVIAAMDRVYWRVYAASKQFEVRRQQFELAKSQLERAQRFVDAGQHAQIEVIRAEAGLAQSLESIILAENNLRDRQRELKLTLNKAGLETHTNVFIIATTEPNPTHYTFESARLIEQAIENRMEMLELEFQIAKSISTIDFRRNQMLPLVTLDYQYNVNGLGATRSDAYDLLDDHRFNDHYLGLRLQVPLGNQAAKSYLRAAFYERRQLLASKDNQKAIIEVDVLRAMDQLESNWQRILAARQSTLLEDRLYQAEIHQFENGLSTSTDVLEAQTNFVNAQSTEINALTEYQIALVDLAYATGTLLGAAQVDWEPAAADLK
jgi:outer membrane protein